MIASERRWALMRELRGNPEPSLSELLDKLSHVDLVLIEGFKSEAYPKIEIHRAANGKPALFQNDPSVVGVVTDTIVSTALPVEHLDDIAAIAAMILNLAVRREDLLAPC